MELKRYEQAIEDKSRYLELRPDEAYGYRTRADASVAVERSAEAIADLTKAIELTPRVQDYDRRASYWIRLAELNEAISDLTRVIDWKAKPWISIAVLQHGMAYELLEVPKMALADYARATTLAGPLAEYARLWQYTLLSELGRNDEAQIVLDSRRHSAGDGVWIGRLFEMLTGEIEDAELLLAATTDDQRAEAHYYIGRRALLDGSESHARKSLAECVALDHTDIVETDFARARLKQLQDGTASVE